MSTLASLLLRWIVIGSLAIVKGILQRGFRGPSDRGAVKVKLPTRSSVQIHGSQHGQAEGPRLQKCLSLVQGNKSLSHHAAALFGRLWILEPH